MELVLQVERICFETAFDHESGFKTENPIKHRNNSDQQSLRKYAVKTKASWFLPNPVGGAYSALIIPN